MKQVELTKENAQQMIDSGIESLRVLVITTYPELDSYENITTWEKVCERLKLNPLHYTDVLDAYPAIKLEYIFEAIRGSEQAVFDGKTEWCFVWWNMIENRFDYSGCHDSFSIVSARLCLQDVPRIKHVVKYFEDDLKKYFIR